MNLEKYQTPADKWAGRIRLPREVPRLSVNVGTIVDCIHNNLRPLLTDPALNIEVILSRIKVVNCETKKALENLEEISKFIIVLEESLKLNIETDPLYQDWNSIAEKIEDLSNCLEVVAENMQEINLLLDSGNQSSEKIRSYSVSLKDVNSNLKNANRVMYYSLLEDFNTRLKEVKGLCFYI